MLLSLSPDGPRVICDEFAKEPWLVAKFIWYLNGKMAVEQSFNEKM